METPFSVCWLLAANTQDATTPVQETVKFAVGDCDPTYWIVKTSLFDPITA
jgi:hypothetical protein